MFGSSLSYFSVCNCFLTLLFLPKFSPFYVFFAPCKWTYYLMAVPLFLQVSIFLLVGIVLAGAALGYWIVRKFVISKDGTVDVGVAQFVKWAMRIIATTSIFQVCNFIHVGYYVELVNFPVLILLICTQHSLMIICDRQMAWVWVLLGPGIQLILKFLFDE